MVIWYGSGGNTVPLISESEIAQLFDICSNTKIVRFGVTIESKQQQNEPAHVMTEEMDDQPVHAPFFAWPKQAYEGEYEDDEPVGCNEESTYLHEENVESKENAEPQKNVEPKAARVPLGTLDVDNSYDPQHVRGDDEALLANNMAPTYIHDKNNPRIEVEASITATSSPKTPTKQGTQLGSPTSPMTRQRAAAIAIASTPPSASTRSKIAAPSPLLNAM
ncbi:hypothetical protein D1007_58844 [Hordeum vulgare]|nr:hypothetical protein D1007_58844 [Hordeum vulgare]